MKKNWRNSVMMLLLAVCALFSFYGLEDGAKQAGKEACALMESAAERTDSLTDDQTYGGNQGYIDANDHQQGRSANATNGKQKQAKKGNGPSAAGLACTFADQFNHRSFNKKAERRLSLPATHSVSRLYYVIALRRIII